MRVIRRFYQVCNQSYFFINLICYHSNKILLNKRLMLTVGLEANYDAQIVSIYAGYSIILSSV